MKYIYGFQECKMNYSIKSIRIRFIIRININNQHEINNSF